MSDSFEILVDVDVKAEEASRVADAVVTRFREMGVITGSPNVNCVLGGIGYRPGPTIAKSYELEEHECVFWERSCFRNGRDGTPCYSSQRA